MRPVLQLLLEAKADVSARTGGPKLGPMGPRVRQKLGRWTPFFDGKMASFHGKMEENGKFSLENGKFDEISQEDPKFSPS